eukprot:2329951-Heterocapsa_arctica.AAC.1
MANLPVLESLSNAWSNRGWLRADLTQAPATWMTPRYLNQSPTSGPARPFEVVAGRRRGGEPAALDHVVLGSGILGKVW